MQRFWAIIQVFTSHQLFYIVLVLLPQDARTLFAFQQQVVSCRDVVELVSFDLLLSLRWFYVMVFLEYRRDLRIDRYRLLPEEYRRGIGRLMLNLSVPGVSTDVSNCKSLFRIRVKNFRY